MHEPQPHGDPGFLDNVRNAFASPRLWLDRIVVLAYAVAAGLCVVGFTILADSAFGLFERLRSWNPWIVLVWTPALTATIVYCTRRWAPASSGSGIPQVIAALDPDTAPQGRKKYVSLWLSAAKVVLSAGGLLAGLSVGREGPSVQVAAGVMDHARRWLGPGSSINESALLVAGGAAGIAAAFNAPLAGVVFAIEELSRKLESRSSGLIIAAIVLAGLIAVSTFGNLTYFGVIRVAQLGWPALLPSIAVTIAAGLLGGLFARLLAQSLTGNVRTIGRVGEWRRRFPIRFAAIGGLVVAIIGLVSGGATYGAGSESVKQMLAGHTDVPAIYVVLKFVATWLTAWCGVPGGIFAPSLSIGAGVGQTIAELLGSPGFAPALIAIGMASFLAAVTQAPLTSFIIVMEMVDGHSMVLSLMTAAMLSSLISRLLTRPLYETLAEAMIRAHANADAHAHATALVESHPEAQAIRARVRDPRPAPRE